MVDLIKDDADLNLLIQKSELSIQNRLFHELGVSRDPRSLKLLTGLFENRKTHPLLIPDIVRALAKKDGTIVKEMLLNLFHDSELSDSQRPLVAYALVTNYSIQEAEDYLETTAASSLDEFVKKEAAYYVLKLHNKRQ